MQTFLILVAALALGYSGGYIALSSSRERELERLRQGINELLLELEYTAEESCERLVKERLKLEKLIAQMPGQKPKVASQPPLEPKTQAAPQPPPLWSRVAQLAQKGSNQAEIAQQLGLGQGEVELILNLARNQKTIHR